MFILQMVIFARNLQLITCSPDQQQNISTDNCFNLKPTTDGYLTANCSNRNLSIFQTDQGILENASKILIRHNEITTLPEDGFKSLKYLDLAFNKLSTLTEENFVGMPGLEYLDLRFNPEAYIATLKPSTFQPLSGLRVLRITASMDDDQLLVLLNATKNFLYSIEELEITNVTSLDNAVTLGSTFINLKTLIIYNCKSKNQKITRSTFAPLQRTQLTSLTLRQCQVRGVENVSFAMLKNLTTLNVACNPEIKFVDLSRALQYQERLHTLIIDDINKDHGTKISISSEFCKSTLRRLSAQNIHITRITANIREENCFPNLEMLAVDYSIMLEEPVFYPNVTTMLPRSLKQFSYSYAYTIDSETHRQLFCKYPNAIDIHTDDFFRRDVQPSGPLRNCENNYGRVIDPLPESLTAIYADHLNPDSTTEGAVLFRQINPNNNVTLLDISRSSMFKILFNTNLKTWCNLEVLNASRLGLHVVKGGLLKNASTLRVLDLSYNNLWEVNSTDLAAQFDSLTSLQILNLSYNTLTEVDSNLLSMMHSIREVKFKGNKLVNFSTNLSTANKLELLDLTENSLQFLGSAFIQELDKFSKDHNLTLDILGNNFRCDCDTVDFIDWYQSTKVAIPRKSNISCMHNNEHFQLTNYPLSDLRYECSAYQRNIKIAISSVVLIVLASTVGGIFLFKYRWHVRWFWFKLRKGYLKTGHSVNCQYCTYVVYDSSSTETGTNRWRWINTELTDRIEKDWALGKVFINDRYGLGGGSRHDDIFAGISSSRSVLLLVDEGFVSDTWCEVAMIIAFLEKKEDIIVMLLDDQPTSIGEANLRLLNIIRNTNKSIECSKIGDYWPKLQTILEQYSTNDNHKAHNLSKLQMVLRQHSIKNGDKVQNMNSLKNKEDEEKQRLLLQPLKTRYGMGC